ncbi:hypothetical protein P8Q88_06035 [Qipengyuania sp. XHP0207]|uniref:hypothetical protein n=1 Tax=Qipengyuania sp. XHP0207 TaxID=3038078 RepID=UPI00241F4A7C|nr:hypothetical protein [Qipengyuania sp. XHP0207]MDG5747734.1 hypothetical protein [Qipengyuania sp. XHP0207]
MPARLALFHGAYRVVNGCLVFDMGGEQPALVRFGRDSTIAIFADRFSVDGQVTALDARTTLGGGFDDENAYDLLVEPPAPACAFPVIGR